MDNDSTPESPVERLLSQIEAQCRLARAAIKDEREASLREAVAYIEGDGLELALMVRGF